jgi:hypothetical protein
MKIRGLEKCQIAKSEFKIPNMNGHATLCAESKNGDKRLCIYYTVVIIIWFI